MSTEIDGQFLKLMKLKLLIEMVFLVSYKFWFEKHND